MADPISISISKKDSSMAEKIDESQIAGKTPVSLLHEICTRNNVTPKYDLLQIEGAIHEPIFQYRLTLEYNGRIYEETGTGRSKKEAKHNTARAMLKSMEVVAPDELFQLGDTSFNCTEDTGSTHSGEGDAGNPVGILQELCMKMKYPPPTYEVEYKTAQVHSEEGLPHERLFAIACRVGEQYVEIGKGKSKKLAKRTAAHNMARKLKSLPLESSASRVYEDDDDLIIERLRALNAPKRVKRSKRKKAPKKIGTSSSNTDKSSNSKETFLQTQNFKNMTGSVIDNLRDPSFMLEPHEKIPFIKKLAGDQDFEAMYIIAEDLSRSGLYQCMLQVTLDPPVVLIGEGETVRDAKRNAADDCIRFLKQLSKVPGTMDR